MSTLVVAEHDNFKLKPTVYPVVQAANFFSKPITILVIGYQCHAVVQAASQISHVEKVLYVDALCYQYPLAETLVLLIAGLGSSFTHILAPASTFGKNLMPRIAALLNVAQISNVVKIINENTFVQPIYAGNALATLKSFDLIKILTIQTTAFSPAPLKDNNSPIEKVIVQNSVQTLSQFINRISTSSEYPQLETAQIVIGVGRGIESQQHFFWIEKLAQKLNAAIGASRAAVDMGLLSNDFQIGQTGKVIAPKLYLAIGISGALQHLAGIKASQTIVAINQDPDAPIFQIADYGLVGKIKEILLILCQ